MLESTTGLNTWQPRFGRWGKGLLLGLAATLFCLALNHGYALEETLGLDSLFFLRGRRPVPTEVVLVPIDEITTKKLGQPDLPRLWPRSLHAQLLETLRARGAREVIFDMHFGDRFDCKGPGNDARFASAIRDFGNVILAALLKRERAFDTTQRHIGGLGTPVRINYPLEEFRDAARGVSVFPLRFGERIIDFSSFVPEAGGLPSIPVLAFHAFAEKQFAELETAAGSKASGAASKEPALLDRISALQQIFLSRQGRLDFSDVYVNKKPDEQRLLSTLIDIHQAGDQRFLDYYGPPRAITTVPYWQLLLEPSRVKIDLKDKVVFVGYADEARSEMKDNFTTPMSRFKGRHLSGVEIMATAFANLLENRRLRLPPPSLEIALLIAWGIALAGGLLYLRPASAIAWSLLLTNSYLAGAVFVFSRFGLWLPVIVPLLQVTLIGLAATTWRYFLQDQEIRRVRTVLGRILPPSTVANLIDSSSPIERDAVVEAVCFASDIKAYVAQTRELDPSSLRKLMNRYFAALSAPIHDHRGLVTDIAGDALIAVWAAKQLNDELRLAACQAAVAAYRSAGDYQDPITRRTLATRIGLHRGELALGIITAGGHWEFRSVGDVVATASRIEQLNKDLGTRVLASGQVVEELRGLATRLLGVFLLEGYGQPLAIHELLGPEDQITDDQRKLNLRFAAALGAFHARRWQEAIDRFEQVRKFCGEDGPSAFYLREARTCLEHPPEEPWDGRVVVLKRTDTTAPTHVGSYRT
jgi:adenylate cyclase